MLFSLSLMMMMMMMNFKNYFYILTYTMVFMFNFYLILKNHEYNLYYNKMIFDLMSNSLSSLSILIILLMMMSSYKTLNYYTKYIFMFLTLGIVCCFISENMFFMFFFFEVSLLPLFLFIVSKGASPERLMAGLFMVLYTLAGSLPFLIFLLKMNKNLSMINFMMNYNYINLNNTMYILMMLMFLIKLPMYTLHLWLPKAHVEAPVEGSMILAGLLLKLGGYGLFRILIILNTEKYFLIKIILFSMSLWGAVIISMICFRQTDIKMLIAYSSISHMSLLLMSILTSMKFASYSGLGIMIGHGLCSSCLFYMGNWFYEHFKTRSLILLKGIKILFPMMIYYWLIFSLINMGMPPFLNFLSEIMMIWSIFNFNQNTVIIIIMMLFLSVFYSLTLFLRIGHGKLWFKIFLKNEINMEMLIIFIHILFLFLYMFNISMMMEWN